MGEEFKLGQVLRDMISGFEGIATAKIVYLNGTVQFCLTPECINNEIMKGEYIDVERLEYVNHGISNSLLNL